MHKLIEYVCDELEELERKAEKDGKLSAAEIQYGDTLAHMKKNLLKAEEMEDGYSGDMRYGRPYMSYARSRNARRDSMGRYSRERGYSMSGDDFRAELEELMADAPNDRVRQKMRELMRDM